jgi:SAM-dependent methyltransferase
MAEWHTDFFAGLALDVWRQAIGPDQTEDEADFLEDVFSVPAGSALLDVPCGNGRLTVPLAGRGYHMVGVDSAHDFVEDGREAALTAFEHGKPGEKHHVAFVEGDMRELGTILPPQYSSRAGFDGAFCMGNSFGYFDRAGTMRALNAVATVLKPGAAFVIDSQMVAECFLVNGGVREWVEVGTAPDQIKMLIENKYDCRSNRLDTEYTFMKAGREERRQATHWVYGVGELCTMLEQSEFEIVSLFSNLDGDDFELGAEKLILVARKI